jgi:hypothetical protein
MIMTMNECGHDSNTTTTTTPLQDIGRSVKAT